MNNGWEMIDLRKVRLAEWNYKEEDSTKSKQLLTQIEKNGQLENIIVREIGKDKLEVVNGNHRVPVFLKLGMTSVMSRNLGKISLEAAQRIAIETNETKFDSDPIKLAQLIDSIVAKFNLEDVKSTMPFSGDEIDNMLQMLKFDWQKPPAPDEASPKDSDGSKELGADVRTIALHLKADVAERFEALLKRMKNLLYPENLAEHLSMNEAIEPICKFMECCDDALILGTPPKAVEPSAKPPKKKAILRKK